MRSPHSAQGFTLIEMIVSLGVFSVVALASVGALLMLIGANQRLQGEQSVMTNLSFALDSMTREIRTGTHYFCDSAANYNAGGGNNIFEGGNDLDTILVDNSVPPKPLARDCSGAPGGHDLKGIAFIEGGNSISQNDDRILYFYDRNDGKLYRKVGDDNPESITSTGLFIRDFQIFVTGSAPLSSNSSEQDQAAVTLFVEAAEKDDPASKSYFVQTTITQRTLDI